MVVVAAVDVVEADDDRLAAEETSGEGVGEDGGDQGDHGTIAQTGETSPVAAAGTPIPLKLKASTRFCLVFR